MTKKLLEIVHDKIRVKHYGYQTEKTYISWIKRYILFHHKTHPIIASTLNLKKHTN